MYSFVCVWWFLGTDSGNAFVQVCFGHTFQYSVHGQTMCYDCFRSIVCWSPFSKCILIMEPKAIYLILIIADTLQKLSDDYINRYFSLKRFYILNKEVTKLCCFIHPFLEDLDFPVCTTACSCMKHLYQPYLHNTCIKLMPQSNVVSLQQMVTKMLKLWKRLYELFAHLSEKVIAADSNAGCEELCERLLDCIINKAVGTLLFFPYLPHSSRYGSLHRL